MLPKISDAIAQFIKPITSNAQNNRPQLFERFTPQRRNEDAESNKDPHKESGEQPADSESPLPDNVIPLRPENSIQVRPAHLSPGLPLLGLLISLSDSRKLLLGIGKRLYARMRRESDKRKARKGIILDIKA
ncbi:MAG: hypothetical protein ACJ763_13380 [Bdellovibrionia bacterium]